MTDELLGRQCAFDETKALYGMMRCGESNVDELRELIAVPPRIERRLLTFAKLLPEDEPFITRSLKFRQAVALEFERLVREGLPVVEAEETESGSFEEAVSLPCQNP